MRLEDFVNLTGQPIRFRQVGGGVVTIEPAPQDLKVRINVEYRTTGSAYGIPIVRPYYSWCVPQFSGKILIVLPSVFRELVISGIDTTNILAPDWGNTSEIASDSIGGLIARRFIGA